MKYTKSLSTILVCSALVAACSKTTKSEISSNKNIIDTNVIKAQNIKSDDKAEQLALAGEQLMTPVGFMYANIVFDDALKLDSQNTRARFYKALLKPIMVFEGIAERVRPLAEKQGATDQLNQMISQIPSKGLKDFLTNNKGKNSLKDEASVQDFISEYRAALNEVRLFAKNNKSLELTLNFNLLLAKDAAEKAVKNCEIKNVSEGVYEKGTCDVVSASQIKVGLAEVEAIQHYTAAAQIYTIFATAYDATGLEAVGKFAEGKNLTNEELISAIKSHARLGTLRADQQLSAIVDMGSDLVSSVRNAINMQKELCPAGMPNKNNRPGYLISEGLCIQDSSDLQKTMALFEQALQGPIQTVVSTKSGNVSTTVNVTAPLVKPVQDIKEQLPTKFNNCGNPTNVPDTTLGGIFPNGDGERILKLNGDLNQTCSL